MKVSVTKAAFTLALPLACVTAATAQADVKRAAFLILESELSFSEDLELRDATVPARLVANELRGAVNPEAILYVSTIRLNLGTTLVHQLEGYPDPKQPPVSVLSDQFYSFKGSPYLASGYVFRF